MTISEPEFIPFLLRAKNNTYAGDRGRVASSRTASHDLAYTEGPYAYLDMYRGALPLSARRWSGRTARRCGA